MSDLFQSSGAEFSKDRKYRYVLWRIWDNRPKVLFIALNPSTANENSDDATIRRIKKFAFDWGYGGVYMMNLFGLVTPYPQELIKHADPIGDNNGWLEKIAPKCEKVIFAWGAFKEAKERSDQVIKMFPDAYALVINSDGSPRHPLYVKGDVKPVPYSVKS